MKNTLKLSVLVLLLVSIGLVVGNQLTHSALSAPSAQIDKSSAAGSLILAKTPAPKTVPAVNKTVPAGNLTVPAGMMFVGSIKSNKYHYPSCSGAKQIKPENQIWFSLRMRDPKDMCLVRYVIHLEPIFFTRG
jgi:hypothetical protein